MGKRDGTDHLVETFFYIGLGAILGANLRYFTIEAVAGLVGRAFPWGTLVVNLVGSFILAVAVGWTLKRGPLDTRFSLFLATGFCGGLTTFSTYTAETLNLIIQQHYLAALGNALVSNLACLGAAFLGLVVGSRG